MSQANVEVVRQLFAIGVSQAEIFSDAALEELLDPEVELVTSHEDGGSPFHGLILWEIPDASPPAACEPEGAVDGSHPPSAAANGIAPGGAGSPPRWSGAFSLPMRYPSLRRRLESRRVAGVGALAPL